MNVCQHFCDQLSDYLDGETRDDECRLIEEHLKECPPCEEIFRSLQKTVVICGKGVSDEIPDSVRQRLRAFLREHCGKD